MSKTLQQTQPISIDVWDALKQLHFITSFFGWLFLLLSRLAEPCMTLSAIYVIIEAGIPQLSFPLFHTIAVACMIAAPEIILPGAFIMAARAKAEGKKSGTLSTMCWLFVGLTLITMLNLFVLHLDSTGIALIMFARCATSVGYSIIVRILTYKEITNTKQEATPAPAVKPEELLTPALIDLLTEKLHAQISPSFVTIVREELEKVTLPATSQMVTTIVPTTETKTAQKKVTRNRETQKKETQKLTLISEPAETRLENAYQEMKQEGEKIIVKTLRARAKVRMDTARTWLEEREKAA